MFGLIGKIRAKPGTRDELATILRDGVGGMPGCLSYVVAHDPNDADAIWVSEVWESRELHQGSLALPSVKEAIAAGRPLIAGFEERIETAPIGGHGLAPAQASGETREGFHTITPFLVLADVDGAVAFLREAFGARETFRTTGEAGGLHVEVRIGDAMLMIGGGPGFEDREQTAMLFLYLLDVDAAYRAALAAGATSLQEPADASDGDRRAGVRDPFGNAWYLGTRAPEETDSTQA
jgi:uncharacterized glyoxalase superfamily protein PhnB/quinol monooxygenase YgiN